MPTLPEDWQDGVRQALEAAGLLDWWDSSWAASSDHEWPGPTVQLRPGAPAEAAGLAVQAAAPVQIRVITGESFFRWG